MTDFGELEPLGALGEMRYDPQTKTVEVWNPNSGAWEPDTPQQTKTDKQREALGMGEPAKDCPWYDKNIYGECKPNPIANAGLAVGDFFGRIVTVGLGVALVIAGVVVSGGARNIAVNLYSSAGGKQPHFT
jgi:hypothetical protein